MNREDIIAMAQEAIITHSNENPFDFRFTSVDQLECFARLVAQQERQKVAQWMIQRSYATGQGDSVEDLLKELEWQVEEAEREACIKACEEEIVRVKPIYSVTAENCVRAIRERGQA